MPTEITAPGPKPKDGLFPARATRNLSPKGKVWGGKGRIKTGEEGRVDVGEGVGEGEQKEGRG